MTQVNPRHVFFCPIKRSCILNNEWTRLSKKKKKKKKKREEKRGNDSDFPTSNSLSIEVAFFLFFFFNIMYSLLKYKKPRGALAMA